MQNANQVSLWERISSSGKLAERFIWGADATVNLGDLAQGTTLCGRAEELRGRSVLIMTKDHFATGLAVIELDGVARRLVLCPPDVPSEHVRYAIVATEADAIVHDQSTLLEGIPKLRSTIPCSTNIAPADCNRKGQSTEWILLTSGTTGVPKLVVHNLQTLAGPMARGSVTAKPPGLSSGFYDRASSAVWSTFYDIRRYGGLYLFLRAVCARASLVLSNSEEPVAKFLTRAGMHRVAHLLGSPSLWRRALMSPAASMISPQQIRLSGEVIDQAILDRLHSVYPQAKISYSFATTEAGAVFEVADGFAGFPATYIGRLNSEVELKVEDGSLLVRSTRNALRYLDSQEKGLKDADGFVDTSDMVELRGDRYYFVGRRDGVINVGGIKVHPEEVEAIINQHPQVQMALVRAKESPITGALVIADVVLDKRNDYTNERLDEVRQEILQLCRSELTRHKVPTTINIVPELTVAVTGKISRRHE